MRKLVYIILAATAFASVAASAQESKWSFGATSQWQDNFSPYNTYELSGNHDKWQRSTIMAGLKGGYKGDKFKADLTFKGLRDKRNYFMETDEFKGNFLDDNVDPTSVQWKKGYNDFRDSTWKYNIIFDCDWKISSADNLTVKYEREAQRKIGMTANILAELTGGELIQIGYEHLNNKKSSDKTKIRYVHTFSEGKTLHSNVDAGIVKTDDKSEWTIISEDMSEYMTAYLRTDLDIAADIYYENTVFAGIKNLTGRAGLKTDNHFDGDYLSRLKPSDSEDEAWMLDEDNSKYVRYTAFKYGPYASATWKKGGLSLSGDAYLQMFNRLMNENWKGEQFGWSEPEMIMNAKAGWNIGKGSSLALSYKRNATRPTYDQTNPYLIQGSKADEVIVGNTKLKAAVSNVTGLDYAYKTGSLTLGCGTEFNFSRNEIEKVVDIDTLTNIKTRSWVNSASSRTFNAKVSASWNGKKLKAEASGNYKQYQATLASGKTVPSKTFSAKAKASYQLPWDLKLSADLAYSSPTRKAYTKVSQYITLNTRLEKSWSKLKIWVAGLDLLDRALVTSTTNEEGIYEYIETANYYRRQLVIGVSYNF